MQTENKRMDGQEQENLETVPDENMPETVKEALEEAPGESQENAALYETPERLPTETEDGEVPENDAEVQDEEDGDEDGKLEQTEDGETAVEGEEEDDESERLFSLHYRISQELLYEFQVYTGQKQIAKNKKRTFVMGVVELCIGVLYLVALFFQREPVSYGFMLSLLLLGMGAYGILFPKYMFDKQLRKNVSKMYKKNTYFQNDVQVDFYPNKMVEQSNGQKARTYWHKIVRVQENSQMLLVFISERHCLLIPRSEVEQAGQIEQLDRFLDEICENFEKPRIKE